MESIDIDRIIEMCWEDRTPFEAIEYQFGLKEEDAIKIMRQNLKPCLLYTSPSPRDRQKSRMPSSA